MTKRIRRLVAVLTLTAGVATIALTAPVLPPDTTWGAPHTSDTTWGNPPASDGTAGDDGQDTPAHPADTTWG